MQRQPSSGGIWAVAVLLFLLGPHLGDAIQPSLSAAARPLPPHRHNGRAAQPSPRADRAVRYAVAQVGKPYRWGDEGPAAFDCSGLTWAAWRHAGVAIPRTAEGQRVGLPRVRGRLAPGDLVIYATDGPTKRHVALVVAPRRIVEARGRGIPVRVTRLRPGWLGVVRP